MIASNTCHIKVHGISWCQICITTFLTSIQIREMVELPFPCTCAHESLYSATKFADWLKEQGVTEVEIIPGCCDQRMGLDEDYENN